MSPSSDNDCLNDDLEDYFDISLSDNESESTNATKLYMQKFQNKVDFSMKCDRQRKDKSDRATTDHALDRRSRAILFKMLNQQIFSEINGCISTGKEANIYHVVDANGFDFVTKVYMTSIMPFKSRDKYVTGDFRMRHGYCKSNSWKLVSKWTEKEYRNLIRINQSQLIKVPEPLRLKGVVLLMTFVGKNGVPAPKLKDAASFYDSVDWSDAYKQVVKDVRTLYQKCRLVHADLSEYNLLYLDGKVWMIDVSQAVEHESPHALDYLRNDCFNVNAFFRKQGVDTLTLREFFEWIVDPNLPQPDQQDKTDARLTTLLTDAAQRGINETIVIEDDAFRKVNIPRHLSTAYPFVRDFLRLRRGRLMPDQIYYASVSGLKSDLSGPAQEAIVGEDKHTQSDSDHDSENTTHEGDEEGNQTTDEQPQRRLKPGRPRNESPNSRKARKKLVKDEQAENRRNKVKKHVKRIKNKK